MVKFSKCTRKDGKWHYSGGETASKYGKLDYWLRVAASELPDSKTFFRTCSYVMICGLFERHFWCIKFLSVRNFSVLVVIMPKRLLWQSALHPSTPLLYGCVAHSDSYGEISLIIECGAFHARKNGRFVWRSTEFNEFKHVSPMKVVGSSLR